MIRPRTTGHLANPSTKLEAAPEAVLSETVSPIGASLLALVIVVEGQSSAGPAVKAYQAAIRRKGEEAAAGGPEAMEAALRFVMDADPAQAQRRERIIDKAWVGLPGWRS
jgi:hypothetical protein